ncbi:hypothetical protein FRC07_000681 [Ceratobasidium sp. 392]|nr:hypothetical protein FRC07_000681 [Ceratobasidium sp. 392]
MRFHVLASLLLFTSLHGVLTAPTSDGSVATSEEPSETTSRPAPEPSITPEPTSTRTTTSTADDPNTTSQAIPPTGGGPNCVQTCMSQAADSAGCSSFTDAPCICSSPTFLDIAQTCFSAQQCDPAAVTGANRAYDSTCRNLSMSSDTTTSTDTTTPTSNTSPQPSMTRTTVTRTLSPTSRVPESTEKVVETFVIQSGAVITISSAVYTAGSNLMTTFSGQYGDFAAGHGVSTLGVDVDGSSGTSRPNSEVPRFALGQTLPVTVGTLVVGILIGGLACLGI